MRRVKLTEYIRRETPGPRDVAVSCGGRLGLAAAHKPLLAGTQLRWDSVLLLRAGARATLLLW